MTKEHDYKSVISANIELHSKLAKKYNSVEPHFRPENVSHVTRQIEKLVEKTRAKRWLDLGCGTGFMLKIASPFVDEIWGVDITQAMIDEVDRSCHPNINLVCADTGGFQCRENHFDIVSSYSFLHHLFDIEPTLRTAYRALRPGGILYVDLEPNFHFWKSIDSLDSTLEHDPILTREVESLTRNDEEIKNIYNVSQDIFDAAEFGKAIKGGFTEDFLKEKLVSIGFREIEFFYYWYLGQGWIVNNQEFSKLQQTEFSNLMNIVLQKGLPLTKHLFKYLGASATK